MKESGQSMPRAVMFSCTTVSRVPCGSRLTTTISVSSAPVGETSASRRRE